MIIDVSNTIGRHKFKPEIKYKDLVSEMDKNNIDISVIHCYAESLDNASVQEAIQAFPNRFIALYTVNPWDDNASTDLDDALTNKGFKGLYMDPIRHGYLLSEHEIIYPLLDILQKHHMPVWCYGAAEILCNPILFEHIASDYPEVNIILARMGLQYDNASAVSVANRHKNIYLETSGCMDFNVYRALKTAGVKNVLMGTGTPDAGYYEFELRKIQHALKDDSDGLSYVLGKNAARIFHVKGCDVK